MSGRRREPGRLHFRGDRRERVGGLARARDVAPGEQDLDEEVKAVVQPMPAASSGAALEAALTAYCRAHLAHLKCPRSVDLIDVMPRLPTGKLYKKPLRDKYWAAHQSRIVRAQGGRAPLAPRRRRPRPAPLLSSHA